MTQQTSEQHDVRCLLCLNQVKRQGDVCSQCEPRYMALGRALIEYERQLKPLLDASPRKHIGALMRFVPYVYFTLRELDEPVPHEDKLITHQLTVVSIQRDGSLQRDCWYGHNIPSMLMAATINRDLTKMGFPETPDYFVPIASWQPVPYPDAAPTNNGTTGDGSDGQH
ncbi:MAG TPA: hypothetical protein VFV38_25490 [Ktedonobacteraceae bacterium]|nr:hypothetical protein [Ktedonobacteraceae bacterium]